MSTLRVASVVVALIGSVACSSSSDTGNGSSNSESTGGCSCSVSVDGASATIACGASKCVGGTTYACDSSANATEGGACSDSNGSSGSDNGSSGGSDSGSSGGSDVCQALAYNCANCQASCGYIPITTGCKQDGCPSRAQICRTAEDPSGYCTHVCTTDDDCPIAGGEKGTCTQVNSIKICIVN